MKVDLSSDYDIHICPENDNERSYVRAILDRILFTYDDTVLSAWCCGIKIKGKQEKIGSAEADPD